jgi:DNA-binding GntR family transcriptional regulator
MCKMMIPGVVLPKHKTKAQIAYDFVREAVLNGTIKPGDRLVAKNLAQQLEMSEIPIREALQRLSSEGLVSWMPHIGAKVSDLCVAEIAEILLIRSELEALATKIAADNITDETLRELEMQLEAMDDIITSGVLEQYSALNRKFHLTIYSVIPLPRLRGLIEELLNQQPRARSVFMLNPERVQASHEEHKELVNALRLHARERAAEIVRGQKLKAREAFVGR